MTIIGILLILSSVVKFLAVYVANKNNFANITEGNNSSILFSIGFLLFDALLGIVAGIYLLTA